MNLLRRLALAGLVLVLPLAFWTPFNECFPLSKLLVLLAFGGVALVAGGTVPRHGVYAWLPFWLATAVIGAVAGACRPSAWRSVPEALTLILPPLLAASAVRAGEAGRLARMLVAGALVASVWGLVQALGLEPGEWLSPFHKGVASTLGNPDILGGFLVLPFTLAFSLALLRPSVLRWTAAVVISLALLATEARAAWLGGAAAVAVLLLWGSRGRVCPVVIAAMMAAAAIAASPTVGAPTAGAVPVGEGPVGAGAAGPGRAGEMAARLASPEALFQRLWIWRIAGRALRDSPVMGLGTGAFRGAYLAGQTAEHARGRQDYHYSEHAHLEPLHLAVELGVVGLGVWLWGLACAFRLWWTGPLRKSDPGVWRGIGAGAVGVFVNGLLSFPFHVPPTAVSFWLLLGAGPAAVAPASPAPVGQDRRSSATTGMVAGLLLLAAILVLPFRLATVSVLMREGQVRVLAGFPQAASSEYARARALVAGDWRLFWLSAIAERSSGNPEGGLALAGAGLVLEPDFYELWHESGMAASAMGRDADAEAAYRRALAVNPGFVHSWNNLGNLLGRAGRLVEAEDAQRRALRSDPSLAEARRNLVVTLLRMRKAGEARRIMEGGAP